MTDDTARIVANLRSFADGVNHYSPPSLTVVRQYQRDAAYEIERLATEVETLKAVLSIKDRHNHFDCAVERERLAAEVEALKRAIAGAILDLDAEHRPDWASDEMKARGKEPIGCVICFPGDSDWPCISAMVLDDLHEALGETP